MKKIVYLSLLCMTVATSCDDYLTEEPRSVLSPNNFFGSDAEADAAIAGVYNQWRANQLYGRTLMLWTTYGTDEMVPTRIFGPALPLCDYTLNSTDRGWTDEIWRRMWKIITDVNGVIANVEGNGALSQETQLRVVGEAKFLRALAYYHLTHAFGDTPFYTDDLSPEEIELLTQTNAVTIVESIEQDLADSSNDLPDTAEAGKATKWASKTLQMKLLLYLGRWAEAEAVGEEILSSSGLRLDPDYANIWATRDQDNPEVIWKIVYISNLSGQVHADFYNPRIVDEPADSEQQPALVDALAANGEGFTGFGLSGPSPTLAAGFDDDDTRKAITIVDTYEGIPLNFTYCGKFQGLNQTISPRANHEEDIIIFRLADVILMLAEAENEQGKSAEAAAHIDEIRVRAYEPDRSPLAALSQEDIRDVIFDERRRELAGEGHRRYDLVRWGRLIETVQNVDYGPNFSPQENIQPFHVLFPLNPNIIEIANERAGSEVLVQTPGY